jgi:hypothetical protein
MIGQRNQYELSLQSKKRNSYRTLSNKIVKRGANYDNAE